MIFDLHAHTDYSDGIHPPKVVQNLLSADNRVFTITDHDSLGVHLDKNVCSFTGMELRVKVDDIQIEVLCYGFDIEKARNSKAVKTMAGYANSENIILNALKRKCKESGYKCSEDLKLNSTGLASKSMFEELNKYKENREKCLALKQDTGAFYRYNTNPQSDLFVIECVEGALTLGEVHEFVSECGGLVFLAHPFVYTMSVLERISLINKITPYVDGIECFHRSASRSECMFLISYCKLMGLKISGGSDYHGGRRGDYIGTPYLDLIELFNLHRELKWIRELAGDKIADWD